MGKGSDASVKWRLHVMVALQSLNNSTQNVDVSNPGLG